MKVYKQPLLKSLIVLFLGISFCFSDPAEEEESDEIIELEPFDIESLPVDIEYYYGRLEDYGLEKISSDNSIRFLWIRSFNPALLFEVFDNNPEVSLIVRVYDREKEEWVNFKRRTVTRKAHLSVLQDVVDYYDFYSMPFSEEASGYDGSDWFIEAKIEGKHHVVYRWSPDRNTQFFELGFMFIESVIEEPLSPIF